MSEANMLPRLLLTPIGLGCGMLIGNPLHWAGVESSIIIALGAAVVVGSIVGVVAWATKGTWHLHAWTWPQAVWFALVGLGTGIAFSGIALNANHL